MVDSILEVFENFKIVFKDLPWGKKIALGAVAILMLVGILFTAYVSSTIEYSLLYSNLSQSDMLSITEKLKERQIPFKLERAGTSVSVPVADIYNLRLELAGDGLPSGGAVGFEIFDKSTFGMTEFIQKLNFRRALQGELQRTINSLSSVSSSRVHIVIPKKTLFDDDKSKASASVVLRMRGGTALDKSNVEGIAYLVAASVEGLSASAVTIVDSSGRVLSGGQDDDEASRLSVKQLEYRRNYEASLEKRIRTMLERVVGLGKAIVRVNAEIDYKQEQRTEELFDPNSQVARSEQRNEDKSQGAIIPMGVTGVQSNLPESDSKEAVTGKPASSTRVQETINYEINKITKSIIAPTNIIQKLSVAVMLDGKTEQKTDDEGKTTLEFVPMSAEEKTKVENLVRTAMGFDANRQDTVTIESMQFDVSPILEEAASMEAQQKRDWVLAIISYLGLAIVGIVIIMISLRAMKWFTSSSAEIEELKTFPKTVKQMEMELEGTKVKKKEAANIRQAVMDMIAENPEQAAELVRKWLRAR